MGTICKKKKKKEKKREKSLTLTGLLMEGIGTLDSNNTGA